MSGEILKCIANLRESLLALDLGMNMFNGTIPEMFAKGNSLRNLNLNGNQFEGSLPQSFLNCDKLEVLDLGNNKLTGSFPHWLESLPML